MNILIVGMGFGKAVYGEIYKQRNHRVVYVDLFDPNADYQSIKSIKGERFDVAHICTPNYSHHSLADDAAVISNIVFVEKPGVANSEGWNDLVNDHPNTRIVMVKNNQYRHNIDDMKQAAIKADRVNIHWRNRNRIPSPGSWFTTKHLAFGGVSRDLVPHLLSIYQMLNPNWKTSDITNSFAIQNWNLSNIQDSDYGTVNNNGIYNVDDSCRIQYDEKYNLWGDWRSMEPDDIAVHADDTVFELGLCPESAYESMIDTALANADNDEFWHKQKEMDIWVHQQLEAL